VGAALLEIIGLKSVIVLLNKENFEMKWDNLEEFKTLTFKNSPENDAFAKGMAVYQEAEAKQSGLSYLLPFYAQESVKAAWITQEIKQQQQAMELFFAGLPPDSYAAYYLKLRKFIADMPQTASRYIERMPEHETAFKATGFGDKRLLQSGLYAELLTTYVVLMESHGDQVYAHLNTSSDAVVESLKNRSELQQEVSVYLFNLFEKRSLFKAAEHLALAMLSDNSCQLEGKEQAIFEQYRKMAKGNTAPEIEFKNSKSAFTQLSDLKNKYKLVVFGSGWCPKCVEEIPKIKSFYPQWKKQDDLEVVLISLDTEKEKYETFTKDMSWISSCDLKGWEGQAARDYCVFATPTFYLLDADNKIVLKPISPEQISAWLDMVRGKQL
jgi:thiol-disulfide isomerase/thioredoxin